MYAEPILAYFLVATLTSDKPSIVITSLSGTRQGCPLGAQLFALGLHPHLCALARLVGENGAVIAMDADDIHLIGSPATVGLALSSLTQMSTPVEALSLDCRLSSLGLALSPGKTSILLGKEASPQAFESGLGSDLLSRLDATICHDGHTVLGTPIGTDKFMTTCAQRAVDEAIRVRKLISGLLMDRESTSGSADETGIFAPQAQAEARLKEEHTHFLTG